MFPVHRDLPRGKSWIAFNFWYAASDSDWLLHCCVTGLSLCCVLCAEVLLMQINLLVH